MVKWNTKCRFFNEKFACDTLSSEGYASCKECKFSQEYSKKILILKFGAMGDVLRTTSILSALRKKYGEDILVYWMTYSDSVDLLKNNPLVDKILPYNLESVLRIQQESFDILFSLEIDTPATLLANLVRAREKFGFYFNEGSTLCFNKKAEQYLDTAFLQDKKLINRKTYQELIFGTCELEYQKESPIFNLSENEKEIGKNFLKRYLKSENKKIIGINIGSSSRWKSKFWEIDKIKELIMKMNPDSKVIILAGPNEVGKRNALLKGLKEEGVSVLFNNPNNTLREFASVINICDTIITGDTMALHLASALSKKTIALFFSTPDWEVEDYGFTKKISSPLLKQYLFYNNYSKELADSIFVDSVIRLLNSDKNK
jgi:ADP-heptose:LPS heptosyltransferase